MTPSLGIRVDASNELGLGHLYRCHALSTDLIFSKIFFFSKTKELVEHSFSNEHVIAIPENASLDEEFLIFKSQQKISKIDILLFDLFIYPEGYFQKFQALGVPTVSLHELETTNIGTTLMINCNAFSGYHAIPPTPHQCFGPEYAILRKEILKKPRQRNLAKVQKVLITMGGTDPGRITIKVLKALQKVREDLIFLIHIGPSFKYRDELVDFRPSLDSRFHLMENIEELSDLMAEADLAISAGGNTMYELCFLGIPTLVISQGLHQLEFANQLASEGGVMSLGLHSDVDEINIQNNFNKLLKNIKTRKVLSTNAKKIVDGLGRQRILDKMLTLLPKN